MGGEREDKGPNVHGEHIILFFLLIVPITSLLSAFP
jgi:hypothetical protein